MNFGLLSEIIRTPGGPGHENPVRELRTPTLGKLRNEVNTGRTGNLIERRKGIAGIRLKGVIMKPMKSYSYL